MVQPNLLPQEFSKVLISRLFINRSSSSDEPFADLSDLKKGIVSASVLIGAFFGYDLSSSFLPLISLLYRSLFSGFLSEKFGPKRILFLSSVIVLVPTILLALIGTFMTFVILRLISGLGIGAMSSIGPLYVSEQSSPNRRGTYCAVYQLSITLGIVLDYLFNFFLYGLSYGWRYLTFPSLFISLKLNFPE